MDGTQRPSTWATLFLKLVSPKICNIEWVWLFLHCVGGTRGSKKFVKRFPSFTKTLGTAISPVTFACAGHTCQSPWFLFFPAIESVCSKSTSTEKIGNSWEQQVHLTKQIVVSWKLARQVVFTVSFSQPAPQESSALWFQSTFLSSVPWRAEKLHLRSSILRSFKMRLAALFRSF